MSDEQKNNNDESKAGDFGSTGSEGDSDHGALTGGDSDSDSGGETTSSDSGLGNLPPLSDFDSGDGGFLESDMGSDLPPLSEMASDDGDESLGGLPPISQISVETPVPSGGSVKEEPFGMDAAEAFDTPTSDGNLDTPEPMGGAGFQDLAADSDFSPETPDIGPGPDSDVDTPMFDSAFGGSEGGFADTPSSGTPAPTQAMETPMFETGESSSGGAPSFGFDEGAFGGEGGTPPTPGGPPAFDAGTPIPDFSPDTGMPGQGGALPMEPAAAEDDGKKGKKAKKAKKGGLGILVVAVIVLVVGMVGVLMGPYASSALTFLPNPLKEKLDKLEKDIGGKDAEIARLKKALPKEMMDLPPEERQNLLDEVGALREEKTGLKTEIESKNSELEEIGISLGLAREDLAAKNQEVIEALDAHEDALNDESIVKAQRDGLQSEVTRLQDNVGSLEDADARRVATKDSLKHSIGLLAITIREGIPLTPRKYSHARRVQAIEALQTKVEEANWVGPDVLEEYTRLYIEELEIAKARDYFFAKIPVKDRFGNTSPKWAECLMNGNWSVFFRSLDGKHIGSHENTSLGNTPRYEFREILPEDVKKEIEQEIFASRVDDYEDKIRVIAQKEALTAEGTKMQKLFSSL